jgi:hypothetical protein
MPAIVAEAPFEIKRTYEKRDSLGLHSKTPQRMMHTSSSFFPLAKASGLRRSSRLIVFQRFPNFGANAEVGKVNALFDHGNTLLTEALRLPDRSAECK